MRKNNAITLLAVILAAMLLFTGCGGGNAGNAGGSHRQQQQTDCQPADFPVAKETEHTFPPIPRGLADTVALSPHCLNNDGLPGIVLNFFPQTFDIYRQGIVVDKIPGYVPDTLQQLTAG